MTQQNSRSDLIFLDVFRGLAALYVMIGHCRWLLWEGFSTGFVKHPEVYSFLDKSLMYFFSLFRYGHEAVILFFVLSGFVIHLRYAKNLKAGNEKFGLRDFLKRRVRRIYPPLLLCMGVTLIMDSFGIQGQYDLYMNNSVYGHLNNNFTFDHSPLTFLGNLAFLMRVYVPVFGSNGPLWSLAYEGWFYIFYPLFFLLERRFPYLSFSSIILLFLLSNFIRFDIVLLDKVFGLMLTWWFGVFLSNIYVGRIKLSYNFIMPLVLFIPIMAIDIIHFNNFNLNAVFWALGFLGMFAIGLEFDFINRISMKFVPLRWLGKVSYSLYLNHLPVLLLLSAMIIRFYGKLPHTFGFVFLGIFVTLIISYLMYLLGEKPFIGKK